MFYFSIFFFFFFNDTATTEIYTLSLHDALPISCFRSPVPTRMISNGEYMPAPQTEKQKQVESRMDELAESTSKKLGVDRRRFLAGAGGMAASFLAMNEVFGRFFNVDLAEMFEPAAYAQSAPS